MSVIIWWNVVHSLCITNFIYHTLKTKKQYLSYIYDINFQKEARMSCIILSLKDILEHFCSRSINSIILVILDFSYIRIIQLFKFFVQFYAHRRDVKTSINIFYYQ